MSSPLSKKIHDRLLLRVQWSDLDPVWLQRMVDAARDEDLQGGGLKKRPKVRGDVTTASQRFPARSIAKLRAREDMVPAGLPLIPMILKAYGGSCRFQQKCRDGEAISAGDILGVVMGPPLQLLQAERVLLNFLQRLSGIATNTRRHVAALGKSRTRLLDTRKTTPGWRMLEKYAVACGGGWNHRLGLFDRVMLKDNHLAAANAASGEALSRAVRRARASAPALPVEVEVDALSQITAALDAQPDVILLDNFKPAQLRKAVEQIAGKTLTEASGGISLKNLPQLATLGLDFISTGALVHHSVWTDIGLDWEMS